MAYIHSETLADLDSNRVILASELRTKENKTISGLIGIALNLVLFEHISSIFPILAQSRQASHPLIKSHTNRHTPIETAVSKLRDLVVEMARNHIDVINKQRGNVPRLVNDKPVFS